jgi:hypothetical protein
MALQGVQATLFELLQSTDKNVQDFIASLQPGDSLRGRVIDILTNENKAIINFKGYNLVSQLPQGLNIQKGDIINVLVSQLDNRVFMKIDLAGIGKGIDPQQLISGLNDPQQIIDTLIALKIPVNEQNIFIAQKLMDYHLPVSAENLNDINGSLAQYFSARGIDPESFNIETSADAKSLLVSNFFRLGQELEKVAGSFKDMARILDNRGQLAAITQDSMINDIAVKTINIIKTMDAASIAAPGTGMNIDDNSVVLTIQTQQPSVQQNTGIPQNMGSLAENMQAIVNTAVKEGIIRQSEVQSIMQALGAGNADAAEYTQAAAISNADTAEYTQAAAIGNAVLTVKPGGVLELKYKGLPGIINNIADNFDGKSQPLEDLKAAFTGNIFNNSQAERAAARAIVQQDAASPVPADVKTVVTQLRAVFSAINKNIISPQNSNLQENVKQTASLLGRMNDAVKNITGQFDEMIPAKTGAETAAINDLRTSVLRISDAVKNAQKSLVTAGDTGGIKIASQEYAKYQVTMKEFIEKMDNIPLLKAPPDVQDVSMPAQANLPVDVESTIEALTFLKSRNIPAGSSFIDIMSRYFKSDMKLSGGIESLNTAMGKFAAMPKDTGADQAQFKAMIQTTSDIKRNIQDISIKTSDPSLKGNIIENQLRAFVEKSGLNLENRLLKQVDDQQFLSRQNTVQALAKAADDKAGLAQGINKDNLKSNIMKLTNEIRNIENSKLSATQRETVRQMRDAANDILTNLNALQFMNHKPVSYDMVYTQVPVFFNNKLFNGELQVWYRKGAVKEDLKNNIPVNMVFMLNTSNLGAVKINMTVYKNEVECTVKAENEKAKQLLMRGKNDFLGGLEGMKYNVKIFNIQLDDGNEVSSPPSGEGYINIGRINLQA